MKTYIRHLSFSLFILCFTLHSYSQLQEVPIENIALDKHGYFTPSSLAHFLERAYKEKKLQSEDFRNKEDLEIQRLDEEAKSSPWGTAQLFSINNKKTKAQYILKETKFSEEIEKLIKVATWPEFQSLIYPNKVSGFPQLVLPIAYLSYTHQGEKHKLILMPKAPGIQLSTLMRRFKEDPDDKKLRNLIKQAYKDLGTSMANFYKKYKKEGTGLPGHTRLHGDLHQGNIFYEPTSGQILLIDNERTANTLIKGRTAIDKDLAILFIKTLFVVKWAVNGNFLKDFPYNKWFSLIMPSFIKGFLSVYPKEERKSIFQKVKHGISTYEEKKGEPYYTDKSILGFQVKDIIEPIFKKLEKEYYS